MFFYRIAAFFLVLFHVKPRWLVQCHIVTGPSTYAIEKHMFAFRRSASNRIDQQANMYLQNDMVGWSLYLYDTRTGQAVDFIGAFHSSQPNVHLLSGAPDAKLN